MSLISSRNPKTYRWQKGELISATEACAILGYKSGRNLQDSKRRHALVREFEMLDCPLTLDLRIGGGQRFLRSEFDNFITAKVEAAANQKNKRRRDLQLAA